MPKPNIPDPILPQQDSPSAALSNEKCGVNYHMPTEIRAPYKSTDKFTNMLPIAYAETGIGNQNPDISYPEVKKTKFRVALKDAIDGAREILKNYNDDGYIDDKNRTAINKIIQRAEDYIKYAEDLEDWWEDGFRPDPDKPVFGWPLDVDTMPGCGVGIYAPYKGQLEVSLPVQGKTMVEFTCPSEDQAKEHRADRLRYAQLLFAAMVNARCAQEAAASVGTYYRNKEFAESISGGMVLQPKQPGEGPKPVPGIIITGMPGAGEPPATGEPPSIDDEEPTEADGEAPQIDDEETAKPLKKKKKSNTLLIAGAAAAGLLIFGRK